MMYTIALPVQCWCGFQFQWIKYSNCDSCFEKLMEILQNSVSVAQLQEALKAIGNKAALTILTDAYPGNCLLAPACFADIIQSFSINLFNEHLSLCGIFVL